MVNTSLGYFLVQFYDKKKYNSKTSLVIFLKKILHVLNMEVAYKWLNRPVEVGGTLTSITTTRKTHLQQIHCGYTNNTLQLFLYSDSSAERAQWILIREDDYIE